MRTGNRWRARLAACVLLAATGVHSQEKDNIAGPYVPTPWPIVDELLKLADIRSSDVVYDLGSGDGRLVITAAKRYGARGTGIELDPKLVALATAGAQKEGVGGRVKFVQGDLFESTYRDASVITLYLLPRFVTRLVPKFRDELKPGTRIVSHDYALAPWPPDKILEFEVDEKEAITGSKRTLLYYYVVPAKVAGAWEVALPKSLGDRPLALEMRQDIESTSGVARTPGGVVTVRDPSVRGERIRFALLLNRRLATFTGIVSDRTMRGEVVLSGGNAPEKWSARYLRALPP